MILLWKLWAHIPKSQKIGFVVVLVLMLLASIAEVISIGAIIPFLAVLSDPSQIQKMPAIEKILNIFSISGRDSLVLFITILFSGAILMASAIRLLLLSLTVKLSSSIGADLSYEIYYKILSRPYIFHISTNSGEIINTIANKTSSIVAGGVMPVLTIIGSTLMALAIFIMLSFVNIQISSFALLIFSFLYITIAKLTKRQMRLNSKNIALHSDLLIKHLQHGLGGIRDVLIDGTQIFYCKSFKNSSSQLRHALGSSTLISQAPRFILEAVGMVIIAWFAYYSALRSGDAGVSVIPVLGAFALGAQRLLPLMQQSYASFTSIKGNAESLKDVLSLLEDYSLWVSDEAHQPMLPLFARELVFKNISFKYPGRDGLALSEISFAIKKGGRYGVIGPTGSGKSTLLDVLMGLLEPTAGVIYIDGAPFASLCHQTWRNQIAHVPQSIYLVDGTIEENIALGIPLNLVDKVRLREAAKKAQISDLIETWPEAYKTRVGERGVRLSGGQRQRIAIARALYKSASILVFDEATSALDDGTEALTMAGIESLSKEITVIIVAHRLTTLKNCDQIIEIYGGNVSRVCKYEDIVRHSQN